MQNRLDIIDQLVAEFNALQPMSTENKQRLDKKFRLEFNYNSNHLEGNTLTYGETQLLLLFDDTKGNHTLREYEEMKAHDVALKMVKDWAADKERPLTETNIKNLNEAILVRPFWKEAITPDGQNTRRLIQIGNYKEQPNSVRLQNGELFEYASPADTPILMSELIDWYRTEEHHIHPVTLAAMFHYKFVRIHPFDDGNGRVSRLLMNYVLYKFDLPPVIIKSKEKEAYLRALRRADIGNFEAFIAYIAEQLQWSLEVAIKAAKGESIEEADDLDKEIALWKQQASLKKVTTSHRDDNEVYEIYYKGVKVLFEEFESKHKQFYDLFRKASCFTFRNNGYREGFEWLSEEIDKIVLKTGGMFLAEGEAPEVIPPDDTFQNIFIKINLVEFKHSEVAFSVNPELRIEFEPHRYEIKYAGKKITKFYGEYLSAEEREQIIAESIKATFTEIKNKTV